MCRLRFVARIDFLQVRHVRLEDMSENEYE